MGKVIEMISHLKHNLINQLLFEVDDQDFFAEQTRGNIGLWERLYELYYISIHKLINQLVFEVDNQDVFAEQTRGNIGLYGKGYKNYITFQTKLDKPTIIWSESLNFCRANSIKISL